MPFILRILSMIVLTASTFAQQSVFKNFISAKDGKLYDGDKQFRFISFNIPNLNYTEDEFAFDQKYPYRMPDSFEISDALESINQLGGNVARMYTIPVRNLDEGDYPTYVLAPGKFDEQSFKTLDTMMAIANQKGVRIIFPFVNNWQWMGGRPQYAAFRGKTQDDFWTDPELIEDVKATISFVINRKNTVTGQLYKDDKAILCWETGNELSCPQSWTSIITRYIKSLDNNHLVMDGWTWDANQPIPEEKFNEPSVDILTTHHYEDNPAYMLKNIEMQANHIGNRKVYIVGEFGFISTPATEQILDKVINTRNISGALIWSLRFHRKEGGFYWHSEPLGLGIFKAYHWPGFTSGIEYDESNLLTVMRSKAFEIQNLPFPKILPPATPKLLSFNNPAFISWQGSVGAAYYDVERSENSNGPWNIIGYNISDADVQYAPLLNDVTAEIGKQYYYRVKAKNLAGLSQPSNIIGPVITEYNCLVDEMKNYGSIFHKFGNVTLVSDNDRIYREKMYRLQGDSSASLIYYVKGILKSFHLNGFAEGNEQTLELYVSADNVNYTKVEPKFESIFTGKEFYDYWAPITYSFVNESANQINYVRINFLKKTQIFRVEACYTNQD